MHIPSVSGPPQAQPRSPRSPGDSTFHHRGPRRLVQNMLVGALLYGCVAHIDQTLPIGETEPAVLRWLRKLSEHPLRVSVGLGLICGALRPDRAPP